MDRISVDAATAAAMLAAKPGAELVGQDGNSVGVFVPANLAVEVQFFLAERTRRYEAAFDGIDEARMVAECEAGRGIPHEEVLRRLGLQ